MPASRALLLAVALLAWTPALASAQVADDPATNDPAATLPAGDEACDAACAADEAADAADDPADSADEDATDDDDAADDDAPLPPGTLDAALQDGVVHAGTFAAPRAGRLKAVLVATAGARGPVLGRLTTRVARPGRVALDLRLTAAGESLLADADAGVTLVARTSWTSKRAARVRTAERRVALPLAPDDDADAGDDA